jgi:hypothetical protein
MGNGVERGLMQIEPTTEISLWQDYLAYEDDIAAYITSRCSWTGPNEDALEHDMVYGILLARTLYCWRDPEPLPDVDDIAEMAHRYKIYYNTIYGAATEEQFIENYTRYVEPYYPLTPPTTRV